MCHFPRSLTFILLVALAFSLAGFRAHATAGTITVTTLTDQFGTVPEECSLREAIQAANLRASFGGCTADPLWTSYLIQLGSGIHTLTRAGVEDVNAGGDLDVLPATGLIITINGLPGDTEVDGGDIDRVFDVYGATSAEVLISNLRITNGFGTYGGGVRNAGTLTLAGVVVDENMTQNGYDGGGIYNSGTLQIESAMIDTNSIQAWLSGGGRGGGIFNAGSAVLSLNHVTVFNNDAGAFDNPGNTGGAGAGGGLYNAGNATINYSTFSYNSSGDCLAAASCAAGGGGGIFSINGALTIDNSTISNNTSGDSIGANPILGGGIFAFSGTAVIHDTTIAFNNLGSGTGNQGGGIFIHWQAAVSLRNSIISNNDSGGAGMDCQGTITSQDYNLILDTSGCTLNGTTTHHVPAGQDPHLMELGYYGGFNYTHMLAWNSPAIDSGDPGNCPTYDQRDIARPLDGDLDGSPVCDIGAVEADWAYFGFMPLVVTSSIDP